MQSLLGRTACCPSSFVQQPARSLRKKADQPLRTQWLAGEGVVLPRELIDGAAAEATTCTGKNVLLRISNKANSDGNLQRARATAQAVQVPEVDSIPSEHYPGGNSWQTVKSEQWEGEIQVEGTIPSWLVSTCSTSNCS
jgi:hypothetical protein